MYFVQFVLLIRSEWATAGDDYLGLAVATACNERYCAQDAFLGAAHAVLKCYRYCIAATGGRPFGCYGSSQLW
jgi:phosphoribosylformylglycinamidine (FGAM) synthase-like enzyme